MPVVTVTNTQALNLKISPLQIDAGEMIRCVNVDSYHFGSKKKRLGYETFLGTAVTQGTVNDLWNWTKDDGTTSYLYALANNRVLYYDLNGTATDWTPCGNGTVSGSRIGFGVLENTMIIGDGVTATRHTTDGTSFTNTTIAPIANDFVDYQQRIYAVGTASDLFYSTTGDATNWNTSGTSDSSSIHIPGPGKLIKVFKVSDRLMACKNSNSMHRWDGYNLVDMCTAYGPTSPQSVDQTDGYYLGLNRVGVFGYSGEKPELLSNKVEKQIYNDRGGGIPGDLFNNTPGVVHRFNYFLTAGTVTDDLTNQTITNAIIKYDYQTNEFSNYKIANLPRAYVSYTDPQGYKQLVFGDSTGATYKFGSATTDNGTPIEANMEFVYHGGTMQRKKFNWFRAMFNVGCEAKVQIALADTYNKASKTWVDIGEVSNGIAEFKFPVDNRVGRLLFIRIYEASSSARFEYYGYELDVDIEGTP
jgi:hypothetical protein